jgi:hypothetical protein
VSSHRRPDFELIDIFKSEESSVLQKLSSSSLFQLSSHCSNRNKRLFSTLIPKQLGAYLAPHTYIHSRSHGVDSIKGKFIFSSFLPRRPPEEGGLNLPSTVGCGKLTKIVRNMIELPPYQQNVIVGLLLSDG